jgi:hypothetical protein
LSATKRAALVGGGVGLALAGWGIVKSLAGMGISALYPLTQGMTSEATMDAIAAGDTLYAATTGVISGGMVLLLVLSPLWARTGLDRRLGLAAAAFSLLLAFVMQGLALIVGGLALAGLFALGMAKEIAPDSGTGDRLALILAALGAMVVTTFVPPFVFSAITSQSGVIGFPAAGFLGVLVLANPMLWVLLRASAQAAARPTGSAGPVPVMGGGPMSPMDGGPVPPMAGAGPAPANVPVPPGWMWGYLNLRAAGQRAFGFLYVDPMGGPSFHVVADLVVADLAAPLDMAAIRAAGYRGSRTVRLGAYETLYLAPGAEDFQRQLFEQGGATGTAVLALSPAQIASMALPPMPPWAYTYLGVGAA